MMGKQIALTGLLQFFFCGFLSYIFTQQHLMVLGPLLGWAACIGLFMIPIGCLAWIWHPTRK